jgi:hypothetical protein
VVAAAVGGGGGGGLASERRAPRGSEIWVAAASTRRSWASPLQGSGFRVLVCTRSLPRDQRLPVAAESDPLHLSTTAAISLPPLLSLYHRHYLSTIAAISHHGCVCLSIPLPTLLSLYHRCYLSTIAAISHQATKARAPDPIQQADTGVGARVPFGARKRRDTQRRDTHNERRCEKRLAGACTGMHLIR